MEYDSESDYREALRRLDYNLEYTSVYPNMGCRCNDGGFVARGAKSFYPVWTFYIFNKSSGKSVLTHYFEEHELNSIARKDHFLPEWEVYIKNCNNRQYKKDVWEKLVQGFMDKRDPMEEYLEHPAEDIVDAISYVVKGFLK